MKNIRKMIFMLLVLLFPVIATAQSESELTAMFAEAVEEAGKYALTEMRPTARFNNVSLQRIREDSGEIKARVATYWTTAFTGKSRTTVIDVWLSGRSSAVYLTRYKLFSDDHNIPIANPQDASVNVLLTSSSGSKITRSDNF